MLMDDHRAKANSSLYTVSFDDRHDVLSVDHQSTPKKVKPSETIMREAEDDKQAQLILYYDLT